MCIFWSILCILIKIPSNLLSAKNKKWLRRYLPEELSSVGSGVGNSLLREEAPTCDLPYPKGKEYVVTTLPGEHEHTGLAIEAVDFGMPEGALISFGCEKGIVVDFDDSSNSGGCSPRFASKAGYIKIEIGPGRDLLYLHLQVNSVSAQGLRKGQEITAGQIIGKVGSTGFTCNLTGTGPAPHLHLVLEKTCDGRVCGSLPLKFAELKGRKLQKGVSYKSANKSLAERTAEALAKERQRRESENAQVERALDFFTSVWACYAITNCDRSGLVTTYITEGMHDYLFPESICFGCPQKWEAVELTENHYLPFAAPTAGKDKIVVASQQQWLTEDHQGTYTQDTTVEHSLVREGGVWKVDSYEVIACTYTVTAKGGWVPEDLDGCERIE